MSPARRWSVRSPSRRAAFASFALLAWVIAGAAGGRFAYRVVTRPANTHATSLTLMPKAGSYGPIHLSVFTIPGTAGPGEIDTIVLVNPQEGESFEVNLPDRHVIQADADAPDPRRVATTASPMKQPRVSLTSAELSRRLLAGRGDAVTDAERAGLDELWSLVVHAGPHGLSTRAEHFVVVEADPWQQAGGRPGRLLPLALAAVVGWGWVAFVLARRIRLHELRRHRPEGVAESQLPP